MKRNQLLQLYINHHHHRKAYYMALPAMEPTHGVTVKKNIYKKKK